MPSPNLSRITHPTIFTVILTQPCSKHRNFFKQDFGLANRSKTNKYYRLPVIITVVDPQ
jgi:hypothetical protein